jgi:hypothetical protein
MGKESSYLIRVRLNPRRVHAPVGFSFISYTGELTPLMLHRFNMIYDLAKKEFVKYAENPAKQEKCLQELHDKCQHVDGAWMVREGFLKEESIEIIPGALSSNGVGAGVKVRLAGFPEIQDDGPLYSMGEDRQTVDLGQGIGIPSSWRER